MLQMHWICLLVYVVVYCQLILTFAIHYIIMVCLCASYLVVCLVPTYSTVTRLYCTG
jgi:hypothetical protein